MKNSLSGLLALVLGTSCSNGSNGSTHKSEGGTDHREVPEAASACGLDPRAVVAGWNRAPRTTLMVHPLYDNTTPQMTEAKACLRRWATANGYLFVEQESRIDD